MGTDYRALRGPVASGASLLAGKMIEESAKSMLHFTLRNIDTSEDTYWTLHLQDNAKSYRVTCEHGLY